MKEGIYDHPLMIVEVTKDRVFVYVKDSMIGAVKGYCMVNQYGDSGTMLAKVEFPNPTVKVGQGTLTEAEQEALSKLEREHTRGALTQELARDEIKEH